MSRGSSFSPCSRPPGPGKTVSRVQHNIECVEVRFAQKQVFLDSVRLQHAEAVGVHEGFQRQRSGSEPPVDEGIQQLAA